MARVPTLSFLSSNHLSSLYLLRHTQAASIIPHSIFNSPELLSFTVAHKSCHPRFSLTAIGRRLFLNNYCSPAVACSSAGTQSGRTATESEHRERLIQHLLVREDQLQLLLELQRAALQDGVDLSDLATEYSICPSKKDGGMLGWVRKGKMVPEFEDVAFTAPLNKVVRVKTKFGWHLLQALSERFRILYCKWMPNRTPFEEIGMRLQELENLEGDNQAYYWEAAVLQDIQPEELYTRLQDPRFTEKAQLMDVRESHEISSASIEGFNPYPLSQFGQWAPTITSDLDPSKDTYVLCHHGVRSMQAAQWLQTQGFRRLYNVVGGIHQYSLKADRNVPVY